LLAQRQQLHMQHQQQQALLQQMTGLPGPLAYEASSAGTLEVGSVHNSSLTSLHSTATLTGGLHTGGMPPSSVLAGAASARSSTDPLWGLPAGTLVLQGDGGSCDLSGAVAEFRSRLSLSPVGRPSGDLAAAAAAAGLGPSAADLQQQQQQRLYEEALEFAVSGQEGMVSRGGSGSSGHRLPPGGLGPAGVAAALSPAAANLMAFMSQDDSGHLQQGVYMPGPPQ
jgi:hypothetical protein